MKAVCLFPRVYLYIASTQQQNILSFTRECTQTRHLFFIYLLFRQDALTINKFLQLLKCIHNNWAHESEGTSVSILHLGLEIKIWYFHITHQYCFITTSGVPHICTTQFDFVYDQNTVCLAYLFRLTHNLCYSCGAYK